MPNDWSKINDNGRKNKTKKVINYDKDGNKQVYYHKLNIPKLKKDNKSESSSIDNDI